MDEANELRGHRKVGRMRQVGGRIRMGWKGKERSEEEFDVTHRSCSYVPL
jgi:hypothetical protein